MSATAEQTITPTTPLATHQFLDYFALAYHQVVAERLRAAPEAVLRRANEKSCALDGARRNLGLDAAPITVGSQGVDHRFVH